MTENTIHYTVPGMSEGDASQVIDLLQMRLHAANDLHLTLKHVHWNVVGPHFIAVHEMIDPQVDEVRTMADDLAERIATLGGSPKGTPGAVVAERLWDDYSIGRAQTQEHLGALDVVYRGVIEGFRDAIEKTDKLDLVTQDMLIGQTEKLELFHWFVRAHLEDRGGRVVSTDAPTEEAGAQAASTTG
jgi:starvation-inducible DNA-binding protein